MRNWCQASSHLPLPSSSHFSLSELKNVHQAKSLSEEQIELLQNGYLGSQVSLTVFESGSFNGIPNRISKSVGLWQDVRFGFATRLYVVDQK